MSLATRRFWLSGFPTKSDLSDVRNITQGLAVSPANPDNMLVDCRDYLQYNNKRFFSTDGGKKWKECSYDDDFKRLFLQSQQTTSFCLASNR